MLMVPQLLLQTMCLHAGATVFSFAVALLYVLLELLVYNTISLSKAAQPLIVAGKPKAADVLHMRFSTSCLNSNAINDSCICAIMLPFAGISLLWMGAGWNYYTTMPNEPE